MPTMVSTRELLPLIAPFAPTCPDFITAQQARFAAIEFCERSRAWRHVVTTTVTDREMTPVVPDTATIHEIEFAEWGESRDKLTPVQFSTIKGDIEGRPHYVTQVNPHAITVSPFEEGEIRISMFLKPLSATEYGSDPANPLEDRFNVIPDFFVSIHGSTLAAGTLARILSIPDEPWTNPQEAQRYWMIFQDKLNQSFRANMRGQQRAPIRTRFKDF
ncbi:hypothetical protein PAF17_16040 [Paracoccus sp. Z330]|uniref:Uncharacterized protein n=1 Tax=Paracoccus onchidii TaxID=3017813 RepID=A0ABT4ZJ39_9RHOB|nr:hypothetical protein [Paracoccus onchidii]MDB6179003.1 hypothetical protein [Paracoccus onchidii]